MLDGGCNEWLGCISLYSKEKFEVLIHSRSFPSNYKSKDNQMISTITPLQFPLNFQSQGDLLIEKFRIYIASFQGCFETRKKSMV
jgi:hypothetical protein